MGGEQEQGADQDLGGQDWRQPAAHVDAGELSMLGLGLRGELPALPGEVGLPGS